MTDGEHTSLYRIKEIFDERFRSWQISLPLEDLRGRKRGSIHKEGWTIHYLFGSENGREYLEYFASHRMTNDTLNRIDEDGAASRVGCCQEFYEANNPQAEREYTEHNRAFYREVQEKGLDGRAETAGPPQPDFSSVPCSVCGGAAGRIGGNADRSGAAERAGGPKSQIFIYLCPDCGTQHLLHEVEPGKFHFETLED
jgi:hypothetical protein